MNVLVDGRFDLYAGRTFDSADSASTRAAVAALLDAEVRAVAVVGDDATLAALATAYFEVGRTRAEPLSFLPLAAGDVTTVADMLDAPRASRRTVSRVDRALRTASPRRVDTLKVVDALRPGVHLAFGFGIGAVPLSRRREAVAAALRGSDRVEAEVVVDWEHRASMFAYLMASSLQWSWAGIAMGAGATLRIGDSPLELVRGGTRVGRAVERALGAQAERFERVHIDLNTDYVVDGRVVSVPQARTVAVSHGPQVRILAT